MQTEVLQAQVKEIEHQYGTHWCKVPTEVELAAQKVALLEKIQARRRPLNRVSIDQSNLLPAGQPDRLARLHRAMNGGPGYEVPRNKILNVGRKRRSGWGKWRNQTKAEFSETFYEQVVLPFINQQLTDTETEI